MTGNSEILIVDLRFAMSEVNSAFETRNSPINCCLLHAGTAE